MSATYRIPVFLILLAATDVAAQELQPREPDRAILEAITERGRLLAEYDWAAWHATDALLAAIGRPTGFDSYIAVHGPDGWFVSFGRLTEDRDTFLVAYQASEAPEQPHGFMVTAHEPPTPSDSAALMAARAVQTCLADFGEFSQPYNTVVLPAAAEDLWVYLVPAQTSHAFYWHGGDVRYLVSGDGHQILEKRPLHSSLMQMPAPEDSVVAGVHTAVMDNVPEDTDVFYVLTRSPRIPEIIVTEHFFYEIGIDGNIVWRRK